MAKSGKPKMCAVCGKHPVSRGKSSPARIMRELDLCGVCYGTPEVRERRRKAINRPARPGAPRRQVPAGEACAVCGIRRIAGGESNAGRQARALDLCHTCYGTTASRRKRYRQLNIDTPKARGAQARKRAGSAEAKSGARPKNVAKGDCALCSLRPIAGGESLPAKRAQRLDLCHRCYGTTACRRKRYEQMGLDPHGKRPADAPEPPTPGVVSETAALQEAEMNFLASATALLARARDRHELLEIKVKALTDLDESLQHQAQELILDIHERAQKLAALKHTIRAIAEGRRETEGVSTEQTPSCEFPPGDVGFPEPRKTRTGARPFEQPVTTAAKDEKDQKKESA